MSYDKPQWFLIYTKPHQEKRAKENLENQGNEVFFPMIAFEKAKQPQSFSLKPMFPRYLFIAIDIEKNDWTKIKSTRGVSHLISFGENLALVPDTVMSYLKKIVDRDNIVMVNKHKLKKGDKLILSRGSFKGKEATFLSATSKDRVKILLEFLGDHVVADISEEDIELKKPSVSIESIN